MKTNKKNNYFVTLKKFCLAFVIAAILSVSTLTPQKTFSTKHYQIKVVKLFSKLNYPWGFDFLPDGRIILTEKRGRVLVLNLKTKKALTIATLDEVVNLGQGGLLDVLVDPKFSNQEPYVYLTLSTSDKNQSGTVLMRGELVNNKLENLKTLFKARPFSFSGIHFGSRVRIDDEGFIYISIGDRGNRNQSQNLKAIMGKRLG